jgi:hypothetical protein
MSLFPPKIFQLKKCMKRVFKKLKNWLNKKKDKNQRSGKKRKFIISVGLVIVI